MPFWYKLGAGALLIAALVGWHLFDKQQAVSDAVAAQKEIQAALVQVEVKKALEVSNSLLNSALEDVRKKDEEIKAINSRLDSALSSLQHRPSRTDNTPTPGARGTCTGAELLREDGEFLAREAARADKILKERNYYYEQYERARKALAAHEGADAR